MPRTFFATCILPFLTIVTHAQTGSVTGRVIEESSQLPLVGANVILENTDPLIGATSDADGYFKLDARPGSYNITASVIGFRPITKFNVVITSGNVNTLNFELEEEPRQLGEVVVEARKTAEATTIETPLSIQRLTTEEIKSNPGGNFDISRVIQALPGVGGATGVASFRNDIIIRGGAPNENVYYLGGIEVPIINHFSTQGSAGGPQGILNVSFIEDVTLSTSAFEARYDNVLSSVLQFKQRDGSAERLQGNVRLSAAELAGTLEGPLARNTTFLASARRSYLQLLFEAIDLPIRPNYWDFQYKLTHRFNNKTTLTSLGLGAIDRFTLAIPESSSPENEAIIRASPLVNQDSYVVGVSLQHSIHKGFWNISLSRNVLDNRLDKYEDGTQPVPSTQTLRIRSQEIENKLRVDINQTLLPWKYSAGAMVQAVGFVNDSRNIVRREVRDVNGNVVQSELSSVYNTGINFIKAGIFGQVSRSLAHDKLNLSFGMRSDVNSFTSDGANPLHTISPRGAASYAITGKWKWNASVGTYYKIPIYPMLGFQQNGIFVNQDADYTRSDHYVTGFEFVPASNLRFTLEGFRKNYSNYPISLRDGISIANQGVEFTQVGNEPVVTTGKGRAYGLELFAQQKLTRNLFYTISYTLFKSEFTGLSGAYKPSSWDNRSLLSAILGYKFNSHWEVGFKYRYAGASPITPFDLDASRTNYLTLGTGILDFDQVNSLRLRAFNQADIRIDKKWNLKRTTIDVFLDIQNLFNAKSTGALAYTFERNNDNTGFATTDGLPVQADGSNAIPKILRNDDGTILPTVGFIVSF
ncbi:MAG: carboxypeptidase-like regulatory domain-containing protein [Cyclobacteriaceae bacterium]